jgi:hypothetical protein
MAEKLNHDVTPSSSCRPSRGETYLTIGQDFFSIQEYVMSQYNTSLHHAIVNGSRTHSDILPLKAFFPAATMVYTDIQTLRGLEEPADYGSGIEYAKGMYFTAH